MQIRLAVVKDATRLASYFALNEERFKPWEPNRAPGHFSETQLGSRLAAYEAEHHAGTSAHFVCLDRGEVVAHCSLTNIIYGPFQACFMGYGVSKAHEGKGTMTQVCLQAIDHAFVKLELNRVMANYLPRNHRSGRLLKKLGFVEEGLARRYLKIDGRWEDHLLTSLINPNSL